MIKKKGEIVKHSYVLVKNKRRVQNINMVPNTILKIKLVYSEN